MRESGIPNAGLGVFATNQLALCSRFAPYHGTHVTDPDIAHTSGYCWQVCHMAQFYRFKDFSIWWHKTNIYDMTSMLVSFYHIS